MEAGAEWLLYKYQGFSRSTGEYALENILSLFAGAHVDAHIVGVLSEEENMVSEYECHLTVEFKDSIKATEQEPAERAELLLVFEYDLIAIQSDMMVWSQHFDEVVDVKILRILRSLIVFLIDLLDYAICYHMVYVFIVFVLSVKISN